MKHIIRLLAQIRNDDLYRQVTANALIYHIDEIRRWVGLAKEVRNLPEVRAARLRKARENAAEVRRELASVRAAIARQNYVG